MVILSVLLGKSGRAMYCCKTVKYFLQFRGVRTYIEYIHVDTVLLCISRSIRNSGVEYRGSLIDKEQCRTNFLVVYTVLRSSQNYRYSYRQESAPVSRDRQPPGPNSGVPSPITASLEQSPCTVLRTEDVLHTTMHVGDKAHSRYTRHESTQVSKRK